jgi:hypothetical protein
MMMIGIERKMIVDPVIVLLLLTAEMAEGMKPDGYFVKKYEVSSAPWYLVVSTPVDSWFESSHGFTRT